MLSSSEIKDPRNTARLKSSTSSANLNGRRDIYSPINIKRNRRPQSSSGISRRRKPSWSNRPKTPWKERPASAWRNLPKLNLSARPKTPTSTYRHTVKSTKYDFAEIKEPKTDATLKTWLQYGSVGLIRPRESTVQKKMTKRESLKRLHKRDKLHKGKKILWVKNPEDTFNFENFSDSDETDSDIEVEDETLKALQKRRDFKNTSQKYSGDHARMNFFDTYRDTSLKRIFRGSEEEMITIIDRPISPRRTYIDECHHMALSPEPLFVRKNDRNRSLNLSHYSIGNLKANALAKSLSMLPNLHHLNLSDCRIKSFAMVNIIKSIQDRSKLDTLVSLNLSHNGLNLKSAKLLSDIIGGSKDAKCQLNHIVLKDCSITDQIMKVLCKGLKKNESCTALNLSNNKLGSLSGSHLASILEFTDVLTDLDISWNNIRAEGAKTFVESLPKSQIIKLDVSMNSFGKSSAAATFGRVLPKTLIECLNLTGNLIDSFATCILMNGVVFHTKLKKLILCKNTIGKLGISSVLRALDHVFQDHTRHDLVIDLEDTASDIQESFSGGSQKLAQFDFTEPAGSYELFLDRPEEYALACEILRVANSRTGCQLNKVLYAMPGKKKFSKVKLRREDFGKRDAMMGRPVPIVHIDTGKPFEIPHEGTLKCKLKLMEHMPKFFNAVSKVGFKELHAIISEPQGALNRISTLKAACESFFFNYEQAENLLECFPEDDWHEVAPIILMRTCISDQADEMFERHRSILTGKYAKFVRVIPTDHYELDLADNLQRHLCMTLIRISNDENILALRDDDYQDLSQHGDKSSFRNVKLDDKDYKLTAWFDENNHLPRKGYLTFDFVSRTMAALDSKPITEEEEEELLSEDVIDDALKFRFWLRTRYITSEQLRKVILKLPKPEDFMTLNQKIEGLFHILDDDDGGEVDKLEVMKAILENPDVGDFMCQIPELEPLLEPRTFGPAFDAIDQDGGGSLDIDEFKQMCGIATDIAEVAEQMFEADSDDEWDEEEDAELRARLQQLVADKLNVAAKGARERMSAGSLDEQLDAVMHMFNDCDIGNKEYLTPEEFSELSKNLGVILSPSELETAVEEIDEDGNGQIEVDEYLDWWGDERLIELYELRCDALENGKPYKLLGKNYKGTDEQRLASIRNLFNHQDIGNKGYLEPEEFGRLSLELGVRLGPAELARAVEDIDEDGNGQIEVDEYLEWWGDEALAQLYIDQKNALEAKKPYRMMGKSLSKGTAHERFSIVKHLFDMFDVGGKEYLEPQEFSQLSEELGVHLSPYELMIAIEEIDEDGNGQIEIDEYLDWWADQELIELFESGEHVHSSEFAAEWFEAREKEKEELRKAVEAEHEAELDKIGGNDTAGRANRYMQAKEAAEKKTDRIDYIVAAHSRVVDMYNFHVIWEHLSKSEQLSMMNRLGWLNTFDPVTPERRHYLNLTVREERVITMMLVRLAMVEPGENWLHEHYFNPNFRPGWELPLTWATEVPAEGNLVLTYASSLKGCLPIWSERIKLRKYTCIPISAPLPEGVEYDMDSILGYPMSYTAFIRLVSTQENLLETLNHAMEDNEGFYQKLKYEDEDNDDTNNNQSSSSEYESTSEEEDDLEDLHHDFTKWNPSTHEEKRFYHMIMKYKKNISSADEDMDMEQVLQVEWNSFIKEYKAEKEKHPTLAAVSKRFDKLFESLDW